MFPNFKLSTAIETSSWNSVKKKWKFQINILNACLHALSFIERVILAFAMSYVNTSTVNLGLGLLCFSATCSNISVISWWSVLVVEETLVSGEKH
jgi:hypothetical protein